MSGRRGIRRGGGLRDLSLLQEPTNPVACFIQSDQTGDFGEAPRSEMPRDLLFPMEPVLSVRKGSFNMVVGNGILKLATPADINGMEIRNRIVMTAVHLGYTSDGTVSDRLVEFYRERARGGVGLIVIGGCTVDKYNGRPEMIGLHDDRHGAH